MPRASSRVVASQGTECSPQAGWWVTGLYGLHSFVSLAYEVVWIRLMAASLGMSLPALGVVLAVYTAGLGLGAAGLAWLARRHPLPTRWLFVMVQGALALWGSALPWLLGWVDRGYAAVAPPVESPFHHGLRLVVSAAVLVPPACLIGAVFPLLGELAHRVRRGADGLGAERLYQGGLIWSGMGALAGPFGFIPWLGLSGTSLILGALNGLGALGGLWALRHLGRAPSESQAGAGGPLNRSRARHGHATRPSRDATGRSLVALSAVLGFCLFAVQIVGAHYLWLIVDATPYAEGVLLGTMLLGMATGAATGIRLRQAHVASHWLLWGGLLLSVSAQLLWMGLAADIARLFELLIQQTAWVRSSAVCFFAAHGTLVITVLGGPAFGSGLMFSTLCGLAVSDYERQATPLGRLTAWNYLGSVVGAVGGAFALLPGLGGTGSLAALTAALLLAGGVPLIPSVPSRGARVLVWGGVAAAAVAIVGLGAGADLTFRAEAAGPQTCVLFHHEDAAGIVEVYEDRRSGHRTLLSSRLRQEGGNRPDDLRVQRLQGALPVLLHPAPGRVLVVGLGTGISLAANLRPEVERLTCVELSRGVMRAAALFARDNDHVLADPKVALVHQDGRNFLKLTQERYDLIIQDLFFPYRAGVGHLYTHEHYRRLRARLAPGGRAAQWIALNQVGPLELRSLVRTFSDVFPQTSLWLTGGYLLLYGGSEPLAIDWPVFQSRFGRPAPVEGTDPADFLSMLVSFGDPIRQWSMEAPLNTDDNLFVEYRAAQAFAALNSVALAVANLQALLPLHRPVAGLTAALSADEQEQLDRAHTAARFLWEGVVARARGEMERARQLYERAHRLNPVNYQVRSFLEQDLAARGRQALLSGHEAEAEALLGRALALNGRNPHARFDLALLHARRGEDAAAVADLRRLLQDEPEFPQLHFNLGVSLYRLGRYAEAAEQFARAAAREPTSAAAHFNLANSLAKSGRYEDAVREYQRTLALDPAHHLAHDNLRAIQGWMADRSQR